MTIRQKKSRQKKTGGGIFSNKSLAISSVFGHKTPQGPLGNVDRILNNKIEGWIKDRDNDESLIVDILVDDVVIETGINSNIYRRDVEEAGNGSGVYGFVCDLPSHLTRNIVGRHIEIRKSDDQRKLLIQKVSSEIYFSEELPDTIVPTSDVDVELKDPVDFDSNSQKPSSPPMPNPPMPNPVNVTAPKVKSPIYEGRIEVLSADLLRGWASDAANPGKTFELDVFVDGMFLMKVKNDRPRKDLVKHGKSKGLGGIEIKLLLNELEAGEHKVSLVFPNKKIIESNVVVKGDRRRTALNVGLGLIQPSEVAVIVPIYNAADDLEVCIDRLRRYSPSNLDVILIDDCSPDPRISEILNRAMSCKNFTVLRNEKNMGFTKTVNRGLQEIGRKHAILLNSDARVTPGWTQGMLRAASSRPRVATVTAMSDRAGAFSAPKLGNDNVLPAGVDEITYARAFRRRSLGFYPVVPTGNGFCMFVNRSCIDEVGGLDAEAFPRGYGEENDFCMRAGRVGWTHLIDDCTYVFHDRSKSFGDSKADLLAAGRQVLDSRYPEYKTAIRVFSTSPEIAMARFRARQALSDCSGVTAGLPAILFVVATQTGGTPQTNMDLMQELTEEMSPWLLHCDSNRVTLSRLNGSSMQEVRTHVLSEPVDPLSHRSGEYDAVVGEWLEIVRPAIVHIRHLAWHSLSLPSLAKSRGSSVVFSFHDFYTLCPSVKLLDENGNFCAGKCTASEGECSIELWSADRLPKIKHSWVHVWRKRFSEVLRDCDAYVTTSESARERIVQSLELDANKFFVIPHGRSFMHMDQLRQHPQHGEPIRILVPGNISSAKGREVMTALLEHDKAGLLEFHILGKASNPDELKKYKRLVVHGQYARDDFVRRVAAIGPHLGAVFSIWDETYCHTLTELWSAGVPALVFDFPTVAGRVRASGAGWVLPHADINELYNRIIDLSFNTEEQIRADTSLLLWQRGHGVGRTTRMMAAAYREVYRFSARQGESRPLIAVVCPANVEQTRADASTEMRVWERTINGPDRECLFVRMTPHALLANVRDGLIDGAILQGTVVPKTMVSTLIRAMSDQGVRYVLELDERSSVLSLDPEMSKNSVEYGPALLALIESAAMITSSTEILRDKLSTRSKRSIVLEDLLSERLWRGDLPDREAEEVIRAVYISNNGRIDNFKSISQSLETLVASDKAFRVSVVCAQDVEVPAWAEKITVPDSVTSYSSFIPWLKKISSKFDFALAPVESGEDDVANSTAIALDYTALGLPVLASDNVSVQRIVQKIQSIELVKDGSQNWHKSLVKIIENLRKEGSSRDAIRRLVMAEFGMSRNLAEFDDLLCGISRSADINRIATRRDLGEMEMPQLQVAQ